MEKKQAQGKLIGLKQYIDTVLDFLKNDDIDPDKAVDRVIERTAKELTVQGDA